MIKIKYRTIILRLLWRNTLRNINSRYVILCTITDRLGAPLECGASRGPAGSSSRHKAVGFETVLSLSFSAEVTMSAAVLALMAYTGEA